MLEQFGPSLGRPAAHKLNGLKFLHMKELMRNNMGTTLQTRVETLPPGRRKKIESKAKELMASEMSLVKLRKALKLTQEDVAETLSIRQAGVSRIERRSDLLLSTLRGYIGAMGGDLNLVVEFPDHPPIKLHFGAVGSGNIVK